MSESKWQPVSDDDRDRAIHRNVVHEYGCLYPNTGQRSEINTLTKNIMTTVSISRTTSIPLTVQNLNKCARKILKHKARNCKQFSWTT